jgi:Uma2 family endonuclease
MNATAMDWTTERWSIQHVALPVRFRPPVPMTDNELMAFSEANRPCRVERLATGEILVMTPGGYENNRREARVVWRLAEWAELDGRGEAVSSNAGFNLPDGSTLSPDAAWVSSSRLALLTSAERERYLPFAPDFVIEIRSASDSLAELDRKMEQWIANGVQLGWRIDPYGETVAIYASGLGPVILKRPVAIEGSGPVAGFRLATDALWSETK